MLVWVISVKDKTTLGDWLEQWLKLRRTQLRPRTVEQYGRLIRTHAAPLAHKRLNKIKAEDLQELLTDICDQGKTRTAEQLYVLLRTAFKQAQTLGRIKINPMLAVLRPEHKAAAHAVWTLDEQRAVLRTITGDPYQLEIMLGLCCGLRRGEICGLRWADVDLAGGVIHIAQQRMRLADGRLVDSPPKSDAGQRVIPIPRVLRPLLASRAQIGGLVTNLSPEGLTGALRRVEARAGVSHIGLHGLRHTMATNAVRGGASLRVVQQLLGHASFALTARVYTHPDLDMLRYAVDAAYQSVV